VTQRRDTREISRRTKFAEHSIDFSSASVLIIRPVALDNDYKSNRKDWSRSCLVRRSEDIHLSHLSIPYIISRRDRMQKLKHFGEQIITKSVVLIVKLFAFTSLAA